MLESETPHPHSSPTVPDARSRDAWRALRILSEFVTGFEKMLSLGPSVTLFGSSRLKPEDRYYQMAKETARLIAQKGFTVITGGGPGLMEAGTVGALEAPGATFGLLMDFPGEPANPYLKRHNSLELRYFFVRKVLFVRYAQAFVICPGGFGTMDELFEVLTLIQTKKIKPFPIYLMGSDYWAGLLQWLQDSAVAGGCISLSDLEMVHVTDDPKEVAESIAAFHIKSARLENF
jgi:uncharacterized protein (TIGR00730 family)